MFRKWTVLLVLIGLFLLSVGVSAQTEPTFAEWFWSQDWNQEKLPELDDRIAVEYAAITESVVEPHHIAGRTEFFWYWPDFANAIWEIEPDYELACISGIARNGFNRIYVEEVDEALVGITFHENIHSDTTGLSHGLFEYLDIWGADWTDGFDVRLYGEWGQTNYFDEAFVEILSARYVRQAGFSSYPRNGHAYLVATALLAPVFDEILESGTTLSHLKWLHTNSSVEEFLYLVGKELLEDEEVASISVEGAIERGLSFAFEVQAAQVEATGGLGTRASLDTPLHLSLHPTCGLTLRFSEAQKIELEEHYVFGEYAWWPYYGDWGIFEEDYYLAVDAE